MSSDSFLVAPDSGGACSMSIRKFNNLINQKPSKLGKLGLLLLEVGEDRSLHVLSLEHRHVKK